MKFIGSKDDGSYYPLKMLSYTPLDPTAKSLASNLLTTFNIATCFLLLLLAIAGILMSYKTDPFFTTECIQTCILLFHSCGKQIVLHINKDVMIKLLEDKSKFWKIEDFNQSLQEEATRSYKICKMAIIYFLVISLTCAASFYLRTFILGGSPLFLYIPPKCFLPVSTLQFYLGPPLVGAILASDTIFISLGTSLMVQFKLLSHRFKQLNDATLNQEKLWYQLKELIVYHKFLLDYCKTLNEMFNGVFFIQFMISVVSASVSVFILMEPSSDFFNKLKCLLYFTALITESAFYCFPAEYIDDAASKISDAIYESQWHEINIIQFKRCLGVVMKKAQTQIIFSGCGMVIINLKTFLLISKATFSFYTYLNNVRKL